MIDIRIRPIDLYESDNVIQPGVVLVGDAFASPCPGSGTGTDKVFNDVTQLCSVHIPNWLATPGMDAAKIAQYYDDPVKQAVDSWATGQAFRLRAVTRWIRYFGRLGEGVMRRLRETLPREVAVIGCALLMMSVPAI
jgi:2-polyprenyl-6-methoxyphenol hydroxylase-like FAD-dependent oxidoreductase